MLEQFTSLRVLTIVKFSCNLPMHLDRPLDPFLDLPSLQKLELVSDMRSHGGYCNWTAPALRLLGLAQKRVMDL